MSASLLSLQHTLGGIWDGNLTYPRRHGRAGEEAFAATCATVFTAPPGRSADAHRAFPEFEAQR